MNRNRRKFGEFEKVQLAKGMLKLAKAEGSGFTAVWALSHGYLVRNGLGAGQFLSFRDAADLVDGRARLRLPVEMEYDTGLAVLKLAAIKPEPPAVKIPHQHEARRAAYLAAKGRGR